MKKCLSCGGEIEGDAIYCSYCRRRIKGAWHRRIMAVILIAAIALYAVMHPKEMRIIKRKVQSIGDEIKGKWRGIVDAVSRSRTMDSYIGRNKALDELLK